MICPQGQHTCDMLQIPSQMEEICPLQHRGAASPQLYLKASLHAVSNMQRRQTQLVRAFSKSWK